MLCKTRLATQSSSKHASDINVGGFKILICSLDKDTTESYAGGPIWTDITLVLSSDCKSHWNAGTPSKHGRMSQTAGRKRPRMVSRVCWNLWETWVLSCKFDSLPKLAHNCIIDRCALKSIEGQRSLNCSLAIIIEAWKSRLLDSQPSSCIDIMTCLVLRVSRTSIQHKSRVASLSTAVPIRDRWDTYCSVCAIHDCMPGIQKMQLGSRGHSKGMS